MLVMQKKKNYASYIRENNVDYIKSILDTCVAFDMIGDIFPDQVIRE